MRLLLWNLYCPGLDIAEALYYLQQYAKQMKEQDLE